MRILPRHLIATLFLISMTTIQGFAQPIAAPRVWSIICDQQKFIAQAVICTVTFSDAVTGVDISDFSTSGDDADSVITQVFETEQPQMYRLAVAIDGDATRVAVALIDDDSIMNTAQLPLGGLGLHNGNAISADITPIQTQFAQPTPSPNRQRVDAMRSPRSLVHAVGTYTSLQLTRTGIPVISYQDQSNSQLKLSICDDLFCSHPINATIDATASVGRSSSLALTTADVPIISYYDQTNGDLKLAVCNDTRCSTPTLSIIDSAGRVGRISSIALNSGNVPTISYYDETNQNLKLARCNNPSCSSPTITIIDAVGDDGYYNDIAMNSDNIPVLVYSDDTALDLKLAVCDTYACIHPVITTIESTGDVGAFPDIALTARDIPVISYVDITNAKIKVAVCNTAACTVPVRSVVTSIVYDSDLAHTALALTSRNTAVVSFHDTTTNTLKIITCGDSTCTNPVLSTADYATGSGSFSSLALTDTDDAVVSYYDRTQGNLKLFVGPTTVSAGQPNTFTKTLPAQGQLITSVTTTLSWTSGRKSFIYPNTDTYEYCYSTTKSACTTWISTGTSETATISGLRHNTTYYWDVRATNVAGTTIADRASTHSFNVSLPPAPFAKSTPANKAINQNTRVTLSWAASTRATSYEYCLASTAAACTTWKSTAAGRTAVVSGLAKNKLYYWQVRAKNAVGTTVSASAVWNFKTAP